MVARRKRLTTLIAERQWSEILTRIAFSPEEVQPLAKYWDRSLESYWYFPIDTVCSKKNMPLKVIGALIKDHPLSLKEKSQGGLIPLHFAVGGTSTIMANIVKLLLLHYKEGAAVQTNNGHTPLNTYLWLSKSPSLEVVNILVEAYPDAVRIHNQNNYYPLHYAAQSGDWDISNYLLNLYPKALLKKNDRSQTPRDLVSAHDPQLHDKLLEEEEQRFANTIDTCTQWIETHEHTQSIGVVSNVYDNLSIKGVVTDDDSNGVVSLQTLPSESNTRSNGHQSNRKRCGNAIITPSTMDRPTKSIKTIATDSEGSSFTHPNQDPTFKFQQQLKEVETFWDVTPYSTEGFLQRIESLEKKVFDEIKTGGIKSRILRLVHVNGTDGYTWKEWLCRTESLFVNHDCQSAITDRIGSLEEMMEGNVRTGSLHKRLLDLRT